MVAKGPSPVVRRLPLTKARVHLGAVVKRIHVDKGYVILEKAGIPIAGMMPIDEFEDYLELRDRKVQAHVKRSSRDYKAGRTQPVQALIDDLRGRSPRKRTRRTA